MPHKISIRFLPPIDDDIPSEKIDTGLLDNNSSTFPSVSSPVLYQVLPSRTDIMDCKYAGTVGSKKLGSSCNNNIPVGIDGNLRY